ncbi:MAG TPA: allophanate hydrolase [Burkholderiaceae bacterium]|nr:allophanate hydrolase [Burkholderiaceae bacterium]
MSEPNPPRTLGEWQQALERGTLQPESMIAAAVETLRGARDPAWIHLASDTQLRAQFEALTPKLAAGGRTALPLYGVPFAVKDNIDIAGWPTTAACPAFGHVARRTATTVQRLLDRGAIVIGKTNLDQFATGLVGTRSPYGVVPNAFDDRYICGGSSSGSASVVARGLVPFALGTDTAGSGRVPAGLNNLVGLKPTRGRFSTRGVVPACRTLDCVSVFATTVADAAFVAEALACFDADDPYSRRGPEACGPTTPCPTTLPATLPADPHDLRIGVPRELEFDDDRHAGAAFEAALAALRRLGARLVPFDADPLHEVTALLYDGPWVAERHLVVRDLLRRNPDAIHPVIRDVVAPARAMSADLAFEGQYRLAELQRRIEPLWDLFDLIVVPTTPGAPTIEQALADPVALNSRLGRYTNFVNLLDWCALALPAACRADGLPAGITMLAPAWHDDALVTFGRLWQSREPWPIGNSRRLPAADDEPAQSPRTAVRSPAIVTATSPAGAASPAATSAPTAPGTIRLAVVGAHLTGMPLNDQLTSRGALLVGETRTAPTYRLFALKGSVPPKPGLLRVPEGSPIVVELWDVPAAAFGSFVAAIPPPLGIGTLELIDGGRVLGFICESIALVDATDITAYGGWRAYLSSISRTSGSDRPTQGSAT